MTEDSTRSGDLAIRGSGVAIIAVSLAVYTEALPVVATDLILPIAFGVGIWLVIRNLAAVCLGSGLLALAHSDPYGPDWIAGIAYPVIAVSCFATTISLYAIRFRRHVSDTHEARWRSRR